MEIDDNGLQTSCCETRWSQQLSGLPHKLLQRLMPFQREGVEFALSKNGRCMIADEMGLGKTVQAISVAYAYRKEWPLLVVVPSSLKYPWIEELERWIPELQPGDINLVETKGDTMGISKSKVTILGYGLLTKDSRTLVEALTRQRFGVVVVDESHYLKSRNAERTQILVPLIKSAKRAVLLTGTPALGRPEELFMQIEALYPKMFGTWSDYTKKYCGAHYRYFGAKRQWYFRGASNLEELHQRLSGIMIRRLKAEVLSQLPPKIRQRIPFNLPKESEKEASASFAQWEKLMKGLGSGSVDMENPYPAIMTQITQMYQQTAIAKAGAVKKYINMMLETEQLKFLVFAHHLSMMAACTEAVIEAKVGYIRIDGSVKSSERIQLVNKFQSDPETRVAILSILAAGQGLTFTAASHVVFAELCWNPGHMKQAEDRAHRIGQTSSVNVHYLIAKGTFDTFMWSMLDRKETVTCSTLNGQKQYLNADEDERDKWEFLNFAEAWTPREGNSENIDEDMFFSPSEKKKQHDIRAFFSPSGGKNKRKRTEDEDASPSISSETTSSGKDSEKRKENLVFETQDVDFSPQVKKLRTPQPSLTPRSRKSMTPRSLGAVSLLTPRKLCEPDLSAETWSCEACTFSNSGLLPYCEMCEFPRSSPSSSSSSTSAGPEPRRPQQPPSNKPDQACVVLSEPELSRGKAQPPKPREDKQEEEDEPWKGKQRLGEAEEEEEEERRQLKGKQSAGGRGDNGADAGGCLPPDHTRDWGAAACVSTAADANDDDEGNDGEDAGAAHPIYPSLQFCASQYTDRIYLYSKDSTPLNFSFIPQDIKLTNWDDLPEAFSRCQENRKQVQSFVREWSALTAMKQKMLRRSGLCFKSPARALQQLADTKRPHSSTKRYLGKDEVAQASLNKAQEEGGSVRRVAKKNFFAKRTSGASKSQDEDSGEVEDPPSLEPGYLQAVDSDGVPLCLSCQKPCSTTGEAWDTRFCSHRCQEEFQMRTSQPYMRTRVFEVEKGVCQSCGLQAHELFLKVRDAQLSQRKEMLENTCLAQLTIKQLNEMIRAPVEGDFWQVDHIRPVYQGGGQCSLDNLQTLCTVCHKEVCSCSWGV
ncbi:DNA annealing helicase and endonuclease ZRANB3 isoform X2 [Halichoeres trimaculatus]